MNRLNNRKLTHNARELRKNMTPEERKLWYDFLKDSQENFNRQKVIGRYIVDFYCGSVKLAIELDGSQHYEISGEEYDTRRKQYLDEQGITTVRYLNDDIHHNFENVCLDILRNIRELKERRERTEAEHQ